MKAVRIHQHGGIDVLKYDDISTPNIKQNQCMVKIKMFWHRAIKSNMAEPLLRAGTHL